MRLGVEPHVFLGRAVVLFFVVYFVWTPLAAAYTKLLGALTEGFLFLAETSANAQLHRVTELWVDGTAIYYRNRWFPQLQPPGIPAEWVQANMVLLIPLMVATPAPTWASKAKRLVLALSIALALQVLDLVLTIKAFHAYDLPNSYALYGDLQRRIYGFADAFAQSMDTQLFPFVIWAGIHFRQLVGFPKAAPKASTLPPRAKPRVKRKKRERPDASQS